MKTKNLRDSKQFSNLMRKITNDTAVDFVPFEEEEQFIRDYMDLQELRLSEKTKVRMPFAHF